MERFNGGGGRKQLQWRQHVLDTMATKHRDLVLNDEQIPELGQLQNQIVQFQQLVDEAAEQLENEVDLGEEEYKRYRVRGSVLKELRERKKTMEEEILKMTDAGDAILALIRECSGEAIHRIVRKHAVAENRLIQARRVIQEVQHTWGGIPSQIWQEIEQEFKSLEIVDTKDGLLSLLNHSKKLLQEFRTLAEAFPAAADGGHFPPPMSDIAVVQFLRQRMGEGEELRMIRDFVDAPRQQGPLTLQEVEENIIYHAQLRVVPPGDKKRPREAEGEQQQRQQPPVPMHHMAAAAGQQVWNDPWQQAAAVAAANMAAEAVLQANAASWGGYGRGPGWGGLVCCCMLPYAAVCCFLLL